ncbi:MAG: hypothetical protein ABI972_08945 [Acidobacteriota bacterium]
MTEAATVPKKVSLAQFSPDAQEAIRARAINGNWELKPLVRLLGELAQFDEVNEKATAKAKNWAIGFFVGAFLSIFVGVAVTAVLDRGIGFVLIPICIVLGIVKIVQYKKLKKNDLINDFRVCLRPALRDLANDIDPNQKIKVKMDLSGPCDHKQTSKTDAPPGNYISGKQTTYEDPWCEVRLPIIDGTTAVVQFDVVWYKLDVKKRGSRGKTKFKTKWRKECTARATLLPPAAITWNESSLRDRSDGKLEKVKIVEKDGITCARLERYWSFKNTGEVPGDAPPAREVVGLLLRLHSAMVAPPEVRS